MKRLSSVASAAGVGALLLCSMGFTGGCGGDDSEAPCFDYSTFSKSTVSFKTDVLPVFRNSCGLSSSCHGDSSSPETSVDKRPYLGEPKDKMMSDQQIADVISAIVNVKAAKEPSMKEVTPGDPQKSFLMYKVDHTLSCSQLPCSSGGACGDNMPQNSDPLPIDQRNKIRSWIANGAQNN